MGGQLQDLISDVSRQMGGVERLLASVLQQEKENAAAIGQLRERVAALEADKNWSGEERRKVDRRLGTGDHTFQKLQTDVALLQAQEDQANKEIEGLRKSVGYHGRQLAARRWSKVFWSAAIPAIVSVVAALLMKWIGG